jgi:predicted ArsR family transcriptional regulator
MRKTLVFGAGQGARLAVLDLIKRSTGGLGVKQIAGELGMSYMGVKAHCMALEEEGFLTTWRQPAPKGRPLMFYRLTESGERLFAEPGLGLALSLLRDAGKLFGASAAQKLLALHYRAEAERYAALLGSRAGLDKVKAFVRFREREERMAVFSADQYGWEMHEYHNPQAALMREYPVAQSLELSMIREVLGVPLNRSEEKGRVVFSFRQ